MSTKISWADETWNPIVGCSKISAGCLNCYAERMAHRQAHMEIKRGGPDRYGEVLNCYGKWNGETVFVESALTKPLHWRNPRKIFVCSMSDLFHESVPFETSARIFYIMGLCYWHQFFVLTKRSGRMLEMLTTWHKEQNKGYFFNPHFGPYVEHAGVCNADGEIQEPHLTYLKAMQRHYKPDWNDNPETLGDAGYSLPWPLPNVHLGVTVENQQNVGRIVSLRETPAAKRFLSLEPLLCGFDVDLTGIDYIYVGCESGPNARLCKSHAIRHMIRQGRNADAQVHVKQIPLNGKCNKNFDEWPPEFQIREV